MLALPLASSDLHLDLEMQYLGDSSYENSKGPEALVWYLYLVKI